MSKLEELIQQYCPDGVEYVRLGDVLSVNRGKRLTKTQLSDVPGTERNVYVSVG